MIIYQEVQSRAAESEDSEELPHSELEINHDISIQVDCVFWLVVVLMIIAGRMCADHMCDGYLSPANKLAYITLTALSVITTVPAIMLGYGRLVCWSAVFLLSTCLNLCIKNLSKTIIN